MKEWSQRERSDADRALESVLRAALPSKEDVLGEKHSQLDMTCTKWSVCIPKSRHTDRDARVPAGNSRHVSRSLLAGFMLEACSQPGGGGHGGNFANVARRRRTCGREASDWNISRSPRNALSAFWATSAVSIFRKQRTG